MQSILRTIGLSALISLLLISPFMIMEVVNRRQFNEDFPYMLFSGMWLILFAISLILLPIVRAWLTRDHDQTNAISPKGDAFLTKPWPTAIVSVAILLAPGILPLLDSVGWLSLDRLFNGPNPEVTYLPGMFLTLSLILFPVLAGIIAGRPIASALRAGGSLFAHPIHLIIVGFLLLTFAFGFVTLIVDQWPCFIGVPVCD